MNTIELENTLGISFSQRLPLAFTHGQGTLVWDENGKAYLDFTSGWGVTCLGHAHPVITTALHEQSCRLMQSPNAGFSYSPQRAALLQTMRKILPCELSHTYFCNSGAEANDAAIKLARKITGRNAVISTLGSFHGRSYNTMAVSRGSDNTNRYLPAVTNTTFIPFADLNALQNALTSDTAAFIAEPAQGEGGVRIPHREWLAQAARLCRNNGTLFIADEVQTGFCRTGKFFALEHSEMPVQADLMTMAKGIAGGFPFAAFAVTDAVYQQLELDDHGGTYCGNPLGCAVANAVVTYLHEENIANKVASRGQLLLQALALLQQKFPGLIKEYRGTGLLCALEFFDQSIVRVLTLRCAELGLLIVPTRNGIIRLLPDLLVSEEHIQQAIGILGNVLAEFADS